MLNYESVVNNSSKTRIEKPKRAGKDSSRKKSALRREDSDRDKNRQSSFQLITDLPKSEIFEYCTELWKSLYWRSPRCMQLGLLNPQRYTPEDFNILKSGKQIRQQLGFLRFPVQPLDRILS
jgi:hypothetical protein